MKNQIKKTAFAVVFIASVIATMVLTSCGSIKPCCGNSAKPTVNKYIVKHNNFTKKHYSLN